MNHSTIISQWIEEFVSKPKYLAVPAVKVVEEYGTVFPDAVLLQAAARKVKGKISYFCVKEKKLFMMGWS